MAWRWREVKGRLLVKDDKRSWGGRRCGPGGTCLNSGFRKYNSSGGGEVQGESDRRGAEKVGKKEVRELKAWGVR